MWNDLKSSLNLQWKVIGWLALLFAKTSACLFPPALRTPKLFVRHSINFSTFLRGFRSFDAQLISRRSHPARNSFHSAVFGSEKRISINYEVRKRKKEGKSSRLRSGSQREQQLQLWTDLALRSVFVSFATPDSRSVSKGGDSVGPAACWSVGGLRRTPSSSSDSRATWSSSMPLLIEASSEDSSEASSSPINKSLK